MAGERLAAARVAALFNVARPAYYATLANAGILLLVLWGAFPAPLLLAWFGVLLALTLARIWLHRRYAHAVTPAKAERWEALFALGAVAAGALWTFPPAVFFPQSEPLLQMAVIFVVVGSIIGAAGVYAPSPAAFYGFGALPLIGVIVQLALQPGRTYQLLALMVLVFGAVTVRVYANIHESIVRTLRTQIKNEELVERLAPSEAMFRNLVETSNDLVWSTDATGRWTYLSPAAARRIYGGEPGEMLGREFREVLAQELRERDLAVFSRILGGEAVFDYETRHMRGDGTSVDLSINAVPLRDAAGSVVGATGTARDISRDKAAAAVLYESVEKLRLAVDAADLVYWEWDRDADQLHWGGDPPALLGGADGQTTRWSEYRELVHPDDRERYLAAVASAWEQTGPTSFEYRMIGRDGRVAWISSHGKTLRNGAGRAQRMIGVAQDITERKRQEEEARLLAYHDALTGLPNRRLLDDRLGQALFLAQRRDAGVAVMLIDLDRFKQVNDALGHRAGDAVLREAAHRLAGCVRKADTLARHGGDEFVVVIPDLQSETECQVVAEKILRALELPFRVEGRDFSIGASIGISLYPGDASDGEALLRSADVAMYRAKQGDGDNFRFYAK